MMNKLLPLPSLRSYLGIALFAMIVLLFPYKALAAEAKIHKVTRSGNNITVNFSARADEPLAPGTQRFIIFKYYDNTGGEAATLQVADYTKPIVSSDYTHKAGGIPSGMRVDSVIVDLTIQDRKDPAVATKPLVSARGSTTISSGPPANKAVIQKLDDPLKAGPKRINVKYTYDIGDNNEVKAVVSWDNFPEATTYTVSRSGKTGEIPDITAGVTEVDVSDKSAFPGLNATDTFIVKAFDASGKVVAEGSGKNGMVVRANTEFGSIANIGEYAQRVMKYALPLGIALGVIMTILSGIRLMVSQGAPDKIKDAQEAIQGAVFGLVILILVRLIVDFLFIPNIYDKLPGQTANSGTNSAVATKDKS